MNDKILPLNTKPIIQTYSDIANYLSIISNSPYYNEWLCSNIINLLYTCNKKHDGNDHVLRLCYPDFTTSILTYYEELHWQNKINNGFELINFLKEKINNNYYCIIVLNERYVPNSLNYKNNDYLHRVMLYGYSGNDKCFYFMGHNRDRQYAVSQISFEELINGFFYIQNDCFIQFFKLNNNCCYNMDWYNILNNFIFYIENKIENIGDETNYFDFEAMKQIKALFLKIKSGEITYIDTRITESLKEHKNVIMNKILTFNKMGIIFDNENLIDEYSKVCQAAQLCDNLFLKFKLTNDNKIIDRINNKIDFIITKEMELIQVIINGLENHIDSIKWEESNGFNERNFVIEQINSNNEFLPPDISDKSIKIISNPEAESIIITTNNYFSYHEHKIYYWDKKRILNRIRFSQAEYIIITFSDHSSKVVFSENFCYYKLNDIFFDEKEVSWVRFDIFSNTKIILNFIQTNIYEVDLAYHKPITASSVWKMNDSTADPNLTPDKAVDGNNFTFWNADDKTGAGEYLEVNIGDSVPFNCISISQRYDADRIMGYKLLCSDNGQAWETIDEYSGKLIGFKPKYHYFNTITKCKIRLLITKTEANNEGYSEPGISKLQVYYFE